MQVLCAGLECPELSFEPRCTTAGIYRIQISTDAVGPEPATVVIDLPVFEHAVQTLREEVERIQRAILMGHKVSSAP